MESVRVERFDHLGLAAANPIGTDIFQRNPRLGRHGGFLIEKFQEAFTFFQQYLVNEEVLNDKVKTGKGFR